MNIPLVRWVDRIVGGLLCIIIGLLSQPFPKAKLDPKRILIIKLWAMGEAVVTLPMIHKLRKKYPRANITLLCRDRVRDVYAGSRDIDRVQSAELLHLLGFLRYARKYDVVLDCEPYLKISALYAWWFGRRRIGFSHGVRSLLYTDKVRYNDQQHAVLTYVDLAGPLGIEGTPERLEPVATGRADEKKIDLLFKEWGIKPGDRIVCINPGAAESAKSRNWPAKRFAKVADALVKEFLVKIIITGAKSERAEAEKVSEAMHYASINAAGLTSLKELAVLLKRCALTISNDTGVVHLSPAMGTPTIGLYCPNTPVRWAPYGPGNDYVYKPVREKPCINTHKGQLPACRSHSHMSLIKSADVIEKARRMLYARKH